MRMMVVLIAVVVFVFYLGAVPVRVAVEVSPDRAEHFRLWLGVFDKTRVWRLNVLPREPNKKRKLPIKELAKPARQLYRRTTINRLSIHVSAGDACATALVSGLLQAILSVIAPRARVRPAFDQNGFRLAGACIATARLGHIIIAAVYAASIYLVWRMRTWINGRSKASWPQRWNPFATWWT